MSICNLKQILFEIESILKSLNIHLEIIQKSLQHSVLYEEILKEYNDIILLIRRIYFKQILLKLEISLRDDM
jgi:hypothetical protein